MAVYSKKQAIQIWMACLFIPAVKKIWLREEREKEGRGIEKN